MVTIFLTVFELLKPLLQTFPLLLYCVDMHLLNINDQPSHNFMQALYLNNGTLEFLDNYPKPTAVSHEALIRIRLAGICSTDLEMVRGYVVGFNGVLGHEFVGDVEAVGNIEDKGWIGQRVVGSINIGCGQCAACLENGAEHCPARRVLGIHNQDGVFAEYVTLPVSNLLLVPDKMADETAVFTEPLAAAIRIREQIRVQPTAKTAVVGAGRLGLLIGKVLSLAGTEVTMLGRRQSSLELPAQWGLQTGIADDFTDNSFDFVVEATGNGDGLAQSLRLVRPLGNIILKSTFSDSVEIDLTKLVVAEINVTGSRCGPFAPALRLLGQSAVDVESSIEAEYPLHDGKAAFAAATKAGTRKLLLRPHPSPKMETFS